MKFTSFFLAILFLSIGFTSCSNANQYSDEFKSHAAGRYLYSADEVFELYFQGEKPFIKWRGVENIKTVAIDESSFFVAEFYAKLRLVKQASTQNYYLTKVDPENESNLTYDYLKLSNEFKLPSEHLDAGNFDEALKGYSQIRAQDSTSNLVNEFEFNRIGYSYLRKKEYENAIEVFKLNVALFPQSSNVYDSLADVYKRSGDSLQAFENYKKALELNSGNERAKSFIEAYSQELD